MASIPADGKISHSIVASPGDWYSLVVRDSTGPTLYSSAVYVRR